MARLDDLLTKRDALIDKVADLTSRVSHGDWTIETDLSRSNDALAMLDREIATLRAASGAAAPIRQVRMNTRKGW